MINWYILPFSFFLCLGASLGATEELQSAFSQGLFQKAHIGICVRDCESGETVYERNAEQFFVPASLEKILVSVAAIEFLGPDFRFETTVEYEGAIDLTGTLRGNLIVRGGGDPTLGLDIFPRWKKEVEKYGIKRIEGKIFIDASSFETLMASPYWSFEDLGNYYGAGSSSLTINQNQYLLTFKPGKKEGDQAIVSSIVPLVPHLIFHNEVTMGPKGSGDQVYVFGSEYSEVQFFRGTIALDHPTFTVKAAISDPVGFCAHALQHTFSPIQGVEIVRTKGFRKGRVICKESSEPVRELLVDMNRDSINLYAEHFLKMIGEGNSAKGCQKIEKLLEKQFANICCIRDGAGIARTNLITPKGFVEMLSRIRKDPKWNAVYASFPEIFNSSIRAKTGSFKNTCNLGGYVKTKNGKEYAFAIFCNNFSGAKSTCMKEIERFLFNCADEKPSERVAVLGMAIGNCMDQSADTSAILSRSKRLK